MNLPAIGLQMKVARENAHMTQEQLAASIGCTTQHISAIERGIKTPRLDTFIRIANTLHVSADMLLQDVLEHTENPLACEFSSAVAPLPRKMQLRILKAIRSFSEESDLFDSERSDH